MAALSRISVPRTVLAFLIAPMAPLLAVGFVRALAGGRGALDELMWAFGLMAIGVYPLVAVLGIPAFFALRALRWTSLPAYVGSGAALGVALYLVVLGGRYLAAWLGLCTVSAMIAAACFWLIARPDRHG